MNSIKIEIEMPEEVLKYIDYNDKEYYRKAKELLLYQLIKENKISFGKAAELIGVPKIEYIQDLGKMGIPYFDGDIDEIIKDIQTLTEYLKEK